MNKYIKYFFFQFMTLKIYLLQCPQTQMNAFQTNISLWLNEIQTKRNLFLESWGWEIFHVLLITFLTYLKNSVSFLSYLCFNKNKNKLYRLHSLAFFKTLNEPNTRKPLKSITLQNKHLNQYKCLIALSLSNPSDYRNSLNYE